MILDSRVLNSAHFYLHFRRILESNSRLFHENARILFFIPIPWNLFVAILISISELHRVQFHSYWIFLGNWKQQ